MCNHKFAKLTVNGEIKFPEINGPSGQDINYFSDIARLKKDGYLPYSSSDCPLDGKSYEAIYVEKDGKILQIWREILRAEPVVIDEPAEVKRERAYRSITDGYEAELAYKMRKGYPAEELEAIEKKIDEEREEIKRLYPRDSLNG